MNQKPRQVYLDTHSTTPVDPRVLEVMLPYFSECFGNASSTDHAHGLAASEAVVVARRQVAQIVGGEPQEVIFTSGATESNNLAILGAAFARQEYGRHIVTSVLEHPSVLDTCRHLETLGWEVTYLPVSSDGVHSPEQFQEAVRSDTSLVSVMLANNEIGVIQPLKEIAEAAHNVGAWFHTDATQGIAYVPVNVKDIGADLLSYSAHKIYGPKGIGALYIRTSYPRIRIRKQMHGGGHERAFRSGTLNVPAIVGFGEAARLTSDLRKSESPRVRELRDLLLAGIEQELGQVHLNGSAIHRLPNNLNVAFPGIEARSILTLVSSDISVSLGSACSTGRVEPSHVLRALDDKLSLAHSSIRFGLGRYSTREDVLRATAVISNAVKRLMAFTGRD